MQFVKNRIQNLNNKKIDNIDEVENKTFDADDQNNQKIEIFFNFNDFDIEKSIKKFEQSKKDCTTITIAFNIENDFYFDDKHIIVVFDQLNVVEIENIENNKVFIIDNIIYNKKFLKFDKHKRNYITIDN